MKLNDVKMLIPFLMKHDVVPFLWGAQGMGKTQTIKQIAAEQGLDFVHLHLATQEVGDLVGLLIHGENGTVKHARPEWFPTSGKGILFLDELNRAHPDVLQAMFSLITEGTIHTHTLPDGWKIVAAGNYNTGEFNVTDTSDAAWMSRFCHIDFMPSKEEFVTFASLSGASTVANFVNDHPEMLEVAIKDKSIFDSIRPNRRAWLEYVAPLEKESSLENIRYEVYSGLVGKTAAARFMAARGALSTRISAIDVLNDYDINRKKIQEYSKSSEVRFDVINSTVEEIFVHIQMEKMLTAKQLENFTTFILDLPLEMGLKILNKLVKAEWSQKNDVLNNKEFVDRLKSEKLKKKK